MCVCACVSACVYVISKIIHENDFKSKSNH